MEIINRNMPMDYKIVDTGDLHLGCINCHKEGIREMIASVKDRKNVFIANKGDNLEAINPKDKRWNTGTVDMTVGEQEEWLVEHFAPVSEKIIAWCDGNHEYTLINIRQFGKHIANRLNVPYGGAHYKLRALNDKGRVMNKMLFTHGNGSLNSFAKDPIQSKANMQAKLKMMLQKTGHTDCIAMSMGHVHRPIVVKPTVTDEAILTDNGQQIKQQKRLHSNQHATYIPPECRWYATNPSFLKCYTPNGSGAIGYAEMAMYGPLELGWLEWTIEGGEVVNCEKVII